MADVLAPVVYDGKRFVMRVGRLPLTAVERMRVAGWTVDRMVEAYPRLDREGLGAYLDDDAVETESMLSARADASEYAERREASRLRRLARRINVDGAGRAVDLPRAIPR